MSHLPEMFIYRTYCANQKSAGRTLDEMRAADPQVADILRVRLLYTGLLSQADSFTGQRCRVNDLELEHYLL